MLINPFLMHIIIIRSTFGISTSSLYVLYNDEMSVTLNQHQKMHQMATKKIEFSLSK